LAPPSQGMRRNDVSGERAVLKVNRRLKLIDFDTIAATSAAAK
jgi:hypothetical protein